MPAQPHRYDKAARLVRIGGWVYGLVLVAYAIYVFPIVTYYLGIKGYSSSTIVVIFAAFVFFAGATIWAHMYVANALTKRSQQAKQAGIAIAVFQLIFSFPVGAIFGILIIFHLTSLET